MGGIKEKTDVKLYKVKYKLSDPGYSKFGWVCDECVQDMIKDDVIHPQTYTKLEGKGWVCPVCGKREQGEVE